MGGLLVVLRLTLNTAAEQHGQRRVAAGQQALMRSTPALACNLYLLQRIML